MNLRRPAIESSASLDVPSAYLNKLCVQSAAPKPSGVLGVKLQVTGKLRFSGLATEC